MAAFDKNGVFCPRCMLKWAKSRVFPGGKRHHPLQAWERTATFPRMNPKYQYNSPYLSPAASFRGKVSFKPKSNS